MSNKFLKICVKEPYARDALRKQLHGVWVADDVLATRESEFEIFALDLSKLAPLIANKPAQILSLSRLIAASDKFKSASAFTSKWLGVPYIIFEFGEELKSREQNLVSTYDRHGIAINTKVRIETFKNTTYADCIEWLIAYAVHRRQELGFYLPQLIRAINSLLKDGAIHGPTLISCGKMFSAKTAAFLKLGISGRFKSSRFKRRPLVVGEEVRWYLDRRGITLTEYWRYRPIGKVASVTKVGIALITLGSQTYEFQYNDNVAEVWPVKK